MRAQRSSIILEVGENRGDARLPFVVALQTRAHKQDPALLLQRKWASVFAGGRSCGRLTQKSNPCIRWQSILDAGRKCRGEVPMTNTVFDRIGQLAATISQGRRVCVAGAALSGLGHGSVRVCGSKQAVEPSPFLRSAVRKLQTQTHARYKSGDAFIRFAIGQSLTLDAQCGGVSQVLISRFLPLAGNEFTREVIPPL